MSVGRIGPMQNPPAQPEATRRRAGGGFVKKNQIRRQLTPIRGIVTFPVFP
jgi:hypothetical protein